MHLQLYNLNNSVTGDPICILKQGEHIIGRGDLLHCYDKRASRTHAIIKVGSKNATLTSTHQNPCFFQSNNSSTIVILTKDIPAELADGDKFGIFPEQFWFKTKFQYENASENTSQVHETRIHQTEQPTSSKRLLDEVTNYVEHKIPKIENDSNKQSIVSEDDYSNSTLNNLSGRQSKAPKKELNAHMGVKDCADLNQQSNSGILTKKVSKTLNEALSDSDTEVKASVDLNQQSNFDVVSKNTLKEELSDSDTEVRSSENLQKQNNSEMSTEKLCEAIKEDSDTEIRGSIDLNKQDYSNNLIDKVSNTIKEELSDLDTEVRSSANLEKQNNSDISTEKLCKFIKEELSDSDSENKGPIDLNKQDHSNSLIDKVSNTIKEELSDLDNEMEASGDLSKQSNINLSNNEIEVQTTNAIDESKTLTENCGVIIPSVNDPNQAMPSSSGTAANTKLDNLDKRSRDRCWYGKDCYRKSPHHKKEFSHPGDSDHDSDPKDLRPICRYGAECYRKNKQHRKEYKHPTTSRKPPRKRRETRKTSKAKQLKTNTNESSEDDYDFDDPFFNDSEDEYEEESWSEFDSDDSLNSNNSSEEDEDTRSLMKEAKRFTKQK